MKSVAGFALVLLLAVAVQAKRTSDYVPPPYLERVARAAFTLAVLALPALLAAAAVVVVRSHAAVRHSLVRMGLAWMALIAAGALVAAFDASNDELWNPAFFGAPFVGASLPAAIWFGSPPDRRNIATTATSVFLGALLAGAVATVGIYLVQWGMAEGLPTGW